MDAAILGWTVNRGHVLHAVLRGDAQAARILALGVRFGWRDRLVELPFSSEAELRIECQEMMERSGSRARHPEDHQRAFDRAVHFGGVGLPPLLDFEALHQSVHDQILDRDHGCGIPDVSPERPDQTIEALLPAIEPEIGQAGPFLGLCHQGVGMNSCHRSLSRSVHTFSTMTVDTPGRSVLCPTAVRALFVRSPVGFRDIGGAIGSPVRELRRCSAVGRSRSIAGFGRLAMAAGAMNGTAPSPAAAAAAVPCRSTALSIVEGGKQVPIVEAAISTRDLKPAIGTAVDADPAALLGGTAASDIRALLDERSVLVFPGLGFDDERQIAFTQTLGVQAFENNGVPQENGEKQAIFKVSLDASVNPIGEYLKTSFFWHLDGSMHEVPILASLLSARHLPPDGGATEWANTYAAYDALPDQTRPCWKDSGLCTRTGRSSGS